MAETLDLNYIRSTLENKSNEELLTILRERQDDYNPAVMPVLESILLSRGVSQNDIDAAKSTFIPKPFDPEKEGVKIPKWAKWLMYLCALAAVKYFIGLIMHSTANSLANHH